MIDADYSQIEYRVLTALAKNSGLAELFKNPDSDYHTLMASLMFEVDYASVTKDMRSQAKSFNFGIPYGMGPGSLAILLTGKNTKQTRDEAIEKTEAYFKNQPNTKKFFENVKEQAQVNKYTRTLFNRYRFYSFVDKDGKVNNAKKAAALRQAGNAVIQGCTWGETLIDTKELGIVRIKDAVDNHLHVWDGEKWSEGDILYSGEKRKCIVTFSNGQKFICSPTHKFLVKKNPYKIENYVECRDLVKGTKVKINTASKLVINNYIKDKTKHIVVESVEITDEYIDMYDVCNTDGGYYVADGIITHNTAADIFKISVARNFSYIRNNRLYGDFIIINMIHDEQLTEINVRSLNIQRIARDMMYNMQYDIEGFPPLFIGAGVGMNWAFAKGGDAEMHPLLLKQLADEADTIPIRKAVPDNTDPKDVVDYFQERIHRFSREKLVAYLTDPENFYKPMHPANVSLLNDKFSGERAKLGLSTADLTVENLKAFIAENNLNVKPEWFLASDNVAKDEEVDKEYDEDEEMDDLEEDAEYEFAMIDESDKVFGASLHDLISTFKIYMIKNKVIGIDTKDMYYKTKDAVVDYLSAHVCDEDDPDGMEIVFLTDANVLNRTGIKVKNISLKELEHRYKYCNKNIGKVS